MPHRGEAIERGRRGRRARTGGQETWLGGDGRAGDEATWLGGDGRAGDETWGGARGAAVLARIRAIPPGFVRTYGDVSPGAPRFAGTVLAHGHPPDVPWFRIVRADGSIATHPPARQRALLEAEGVPFRGDNVDMRAARLPD